MDLPETTSKLEMLPFRMGEDCNATVRNELWDFASHRVGRMYRTPFELLMELVNRAQARRDNFLTISSLTAAGCALDLVKVKRFKTDFVLLSQRLYCAEYLHCSPRCVICNKLRLKFRIME